MTRLLLWRHGHTEWNGQQRIQGHADSPLSQLGQRQAAEAAPLLAARGPVAIISSDLQRCTVTAAALADVTGLPVQHDTRLRERSYGEWEGLTMAEIAERWPESHARKVAGADAADLPHGIERPTDVMKRMGEALRDAAEIAAEGTIVVVTHGGASRYGIFEVLGWPLDQIASMAILTNCRYSDLRLGHASGWTLHAHNVGPSEGPPGYE